MADFYGSDSRAIQDRFDTRRLADRWLDRIIRDRIRDEDRTFIEARDMLFLATLDGQGNENCSYKGGEPGFIRVLDDQTIAVPRYDGNGLFLSAGNMIGTRSVGLLFIDFVEQRRMRLNGGSCTGVTR